MSKDLHPIFKQILDDHFPNEHDSEIKRNTPRPRYISNEDYLEWHESREELQESYNGGYEGGGPWF